VPKVNKKLSEMEKWLEKILLIKLTKTKQTKTKIKANKKSTKKEDKRTM